MEIAKNDKVIGYESFCWQDDRFGKVIIIYDWEGEKPKFVIKVMHAFLMSLNSRQVWANKKTSNIGTLPCPCYSKWFSSEYLMVDC